MHSVLRKNEQNDQEEKRRFYRLQYPPALRPTIHVQGNRYSVTEISAEGLRFVNHTAMEAYPGCVLSGNVDFAQGISMPVEGSVLRITDENEIVLHLSQGIPLLLMLQEQWRVLGRIEAE